MISPQNDSAAAGWDPGLIAGDVLRRDALGYRPALRGHAWTLWTTTPG